MVPFFVFLVLTTCQGMFGEDARYWMYLVKSLVGAWMIWEMWPHVKEMRWNFSWEAVVVGVLVCIMWIGLDPHYPMNHLIFQESESGPWNPNLRYGQGSALAWLFIITRIAGSSIVVPPLEEVFYRSFLYRYFISNKWQSVPFGYFAGASFVACSVVFGLVHYQWLAGILCGMIYLGLVIYKKRLGDAITAHAITNFLLGIYIVSKDAWHFW